MKLKLLSFADYWRMINSISSYKKSTKSTKKENQKTNSDQQKFKWLGKSPHYRCKRKRNPNFPQKQIRYTKYPNESVKILLNINQLRITPISSIPTNRLKKRYKSAKKKIEIHRSDRIGIQYLKLFGKSTKSRIFKRKS